MHVFVLYPTTYICIRVGKTQALSCAMLDPAHKITCFHVVFGGSREDVLLSPLSAAARGLFAM